MNWNRMHPQLTAWDKRLVLRTAAPYMVEFLSSPFERLDVLLNLFPVFATGICGRERERGWPSNTASSGKSNRNPPEPFPSF